MKSPPSRRLVTADREPLAPLIRRFPALAALPRVALGRYPTPVEAVSGRGVPPGFWVKREDLGGEALGGNKVRALEVLLGGLERGARVATIGPRGSNHAFATAFYARRIGAEPTVLAWPHTPGAAGEAVWERTRALAATHIVPLPLLLVAAAFVRVRGARWVPMGGSSPAGVLGHVAAVLELAEQIARGDLPAPTRIVVALGSGGTTAGLALGLALAGLPSELIAIRTGPRIASNARTVRRLAARAARLIARRSGASPPAPRPVRVIHTFYGKGYGRPTAAGNEATRVMRDAHGVALDPTYTAKACAGALAAAGGGVTLFWNTFDARCP